MFTLQIPLTSAALDAIKADLRASLPEVKSSHRVEAAARGLGFRSHAALLMALKSPDSNLVAADGSTFRDYLTAHGFDAGAKPFFTAIARVAMRGVMEQEPKLAWNGIGAGRIERRADGTRPTAREHFTAFQARRQDLLQDRVIEEFLRALVFLPRVVRTKTVRNEAHSYRLKHIAENLACTYPDGDVLGPHYVSNGALIAAALHLGFRYRTFLDDLGYDSPNVTFNMSKRSLDDLDCEIRPDGARAEVRRRLEENRRYGWPFSRGGRRAA